MSSIEWSPAHQFITPADKQTHSSKIRPSNVGRIWHVEARVRLTTQRENVYQTFTFTKRASRTALALGLVVPAAIAAIAMTYDVSN
jgi:hypothetical protein